MIDLASWEYDYLHMLLWAMQKAGSVNNLDAIAKAMRSEPYKGLAITKISYDKDNNLATPTQFRVWQDGKYIKTLTLEPGPEMYEHKGLLSPK